MTQMGDLIGTQLNEMNYIPEVEPKDYLVIVGFDNTLTSKIFKDSLKDMKQEMVDEKLLPNADAIDDKFIDKMATDFSSLTFKVNASSTQEAIARVMNTMTYATYMDGITKGLKLYHRVAQDVFSGKAPDNIQEQFTGMLDDDKIEHITKMMMLTNLGMFKDLVESSNKTAEDVVQMNIPSVTSIMCVEEGKEMSMFKMPSSEMDKVANAVSQVLDKLDEEE